MRPKKRSIILAKERVPRRETVIGQGKPGPVSLRLRQAYLDIVRGKNPKYEKWLSPLD